MAGIRKSHPRFRREEDAPHIELTDDDVAILKCIHRYRFVQTADLYRFFANRSPDRISRRLALLYRAKFIDRPVSQINRYEAGGGSKPLIYGLDNAGARFLKGKHGASIGATDWRTRNRSFTRDNLDHTIAVSRFMIDLEVSCRARGNVSLIPFEDILAKAPEATRRAINPASWPVEVRFGGRFATVHITPDAIFGLRIERPAAKALVSYIFLEVDRGTMTISPSRNIQESDAFLHRATILRKFVTYAQSWLGELHRARFGIGAARVLTITTGERRLSAMLDAVMEISERERVPQKLFLFAAGDDGDSLARRYRGLGGADEILLPDK